MSATTDGKPVKADRALPHARAWNIALRTAHIGVTGVLLGGHVFGILPLRLLPWLYLSVLSGAALVIVEAYPNWRWCLEGRGILILSKLALLCLVPLFWNFRVPLLIAVLAIASIGSHMPRTLRHYSIFGK